MQFRTKARAVDLLGKGQIADLPTAITELWKNGYDAYAENLTAEIYLTGYKELSRPLFVMTDDGKGMSRKDILDKWLVLGSDSKSRTHIPDVEGEETLWKAPRIKAGEKGIGRLSVAFLGSPMLMLTKKQGHPLQALFFDWRLLENFNLFLDDVNIPVEHIESIDEFQTKFQSLKNSFKQNLEKKQDKEDKLIWEESQMKLKNEIKTSVDNIIIPSFFYEEILIDIIDKQNHHGTKFIIFKPLEQIIGLAKPDEDDLGYREFIVSSLSGFTNEFKEDKLEVKTSILIRQESDVIRDFLNESGSFFEPKDYDLADIVIKGTLDGNGSFDGELKIYDDDPIEYTYENSRKKNKRSLYGKIDIKLGYSQGYLRESKLNETAYKKIRDKVTQFGGLYIYRDGFRVLPYGRPNFDFLKFEARRNLKAGKYYFSYRRMFGYIELSRSKNKNLKDKAGREGLIKNAPYQAFEYDLIDLFEELAREYFGTEAKQPIFQDKKKEIRNQKEEEAKDKRRETVEKRAFSKSLKEYPNRFSNYQLEYVELIERLGKELEAANITYAQIETLLEKMQKLDIDYKKLLPKIPKRYKLTPTQLDRLEEYGEQLEKFNKTIKKESEELVIEARKRLEVRDLQKDFERNATQYSSALEALVYENQQLLLTQFNDIKKEYSERSNLILKELEYEKQSLRDGIDSRERIIAALDTIKVKFESLRKQFEKDVFPLVEHFKRVDFDVDEELIQGIYKAKYESIKYQWEQTKETAQLGIAVEIIDHEFNQLYAAINYSLRRLDDEISGQSPKRFEYLKKNFKQLEDKYALLSPLYRISGVVPKEVTGKDIYNYLQHFFSSKLEDEKIEFTASSAFQKYSIKIKEPVIYTVFINIINNAIYWLRNSEIKRLELDYLPNTKEILILNSGMKIKNHRLEKVFELFYSTRPNGRGIGLYLAKQSLNENYLNIYASNDKQYNRLDGACFVIAPLK